MPRVSSGLCCRCWQGSRVARIALCFLLCQVCLQVCLTGLAASRPAGAPRVGFPGAAAMVEVAPGGLTAAGPVWGHRPGLAGVGLTPRTSTKPDTPCRLFCDARVARRELHLLVWCLKYLNRSSRSRGRVSSDSSGKSKAVFFYPACIVMSRRWRSKWLHSSRDCSTVTSVQVLQKANCFLSTQCALGLVRPVLNLVSAAFFLSRALFRECPLPRAPTGA